MAASQLLDEPVANTDSIDEPDPSIKWWIESEGSIYDTLEIAQKRDAWRTGNDLPSSRPVAVKSCTSCDETGLDVYDGGYSRDCQVCHGRGFTLVNPKE